MEINGQEFTIKDIFEANVTVPDCLVYGDNKLGRGHGEAKLYINTKDKMREFYGGEGFSAKCFILKKDLITYMHTMQTEYMNPSQNYRSKDEMAKLWEERMKKIATLPDVIEFNIQDQTQIAGPRGYVNSKDEGYEIIREMSLPLVSYISAMKLSDASDTPIYYWRLFADFDAIADKANALVFKYGKKTQEQDEEQAKPQKEERKETELRQARKGQGKYRMRLLEECGFCPITMIVKKELLIASHIKPWAVSNDVERIDPKNGFILSPLYDRLFDQGFITFTNNRHVIVSDWLKDDKRKIGIKNGQFIQHLPMDEERKAYMEYHRNMVFKG